MRVKATREGLLGKISASGYVIDKHVPYVALPSVLALHRLVKISNPKNGHSCCAFVLDVGPWNEHDDEYVFGGARPLAEVGHDERGRTTNAAGIDLGEYVWGKLGLEDNQDVDWEFLMT